MALLLVEDHPRIVLDAIIDALQPMIEPAHGLVAPLGARAVDALVREVVIPRTHPRMDGRRHLLEHAYDAVSVTVLQPSDQKAGYLYVLQPPNGGAPKGAVSLMSEVIERPWGRVHALRERVLVERKLRRAAPALIEVHGYLKFIDVHDAIHVVHVFREERL